MKILYGVAGEGLGHAMRSAVVGKHLESQGHQVTFASSGRALDYLAQRWPGRTIAISGLGTVMKKNKIAVVETLVMNALAQAFSAPASALGFWTMSKVDPALVVSDFDPHVARFAGFFGIPLLAVDNIHFMNRCSHPREVIAGDKQAAAIMYPVVDGAVPNAGRYLVTSFVYAPPSREGTELHLPILRDEILAAKGAPPGNHVVAYFNDKADHELIAQALERVDVPFRLYGHGQTTQSIRRNITYCPLSEENFLRDLSTSRAVIGGAGFTLMTEAIYLGKPMLAVPFEGHFEQILNANYLELLGFGERARDLTTDTISGFIQRAPGHAERLRDFRHDGNEGLLQAVDSVVQGCA